MKKELAVKKIGNLLLIDDELYEPVYISHQRDDELLKFRRVDRKKFESLKKRIVERLKGRLKSGDILENALNDVTMRGLERIDRELDKKKPKIRKEHGCFDLVVGKGKDATTIPIR